MSRDLNSHQFSNAPIPLGWDTVANQVTRMTIPNGVFLNSGLNSRRRLTFRTMIGVNATPADTDERLQRYFGSVVYLHATDAGGPGFNLTDYAISRCNCIHGEVLADTSGSNYFNSKPFAIGFIQVSSLSSPFYPAGVSNTYEFVDNITVIGTQTITAITTMIDYLVSLCDTVDAIVVSSGFAFAGDIRSHINSVHGTQVLDEHRHNGTPRRPTGTGSLEVPANIGTNQMELAMRTIYECVLRRGGPLKVTFTTSIPSPVPLYAINGYQFDHDTDAT